MSVEEQNKKKYKILLRIILAEFVLAEILSFYKVSFEPLLVRTIVLVLFLIPFIMLLYTVSRDTKFKHIYRAFAEIAIWFIGIASVAGLVAELSAMFGK